MKAIKDCKWDVEIDKHHKNFYWRALSLNQKDLGCCYLTSALEYNTKQSAKRNWEKFAKINGIKNWKYV